MKVAIVTNYWKGSQGGGVKTYLSNLAEGLMNDVKEFTSRIETDDVAIFTGELENPLCSVGTL
jgi:hypothetical protein